MKVPNPRASSGFLPSKLPWILDFGKPESFARHQRAALPRGFTLIEIMIVVVIIGIALSMVVANLMPDERERVRQEAQRLQTLFERVRDESAMSGKTIAVELQENTLRFYERDPRSIEVKWLPLERLGTESLSPRQLAKGIDANLVIGHTRKSPASTSVSRDTDGPALFQPAGVAAPFSFKMTSQAGTKSIVVDPLGRISLVESDAP
jgi:type II secretion system protein H